DQDARDLACKLYEASGREADLHAERLEWTQRAAEHQEQAQKAAEHWKLIKAAKLSQLTKAAEHWELTEAAECLQQARKAAELQELTEAAELQELTKTIKDPKSQPSSGQTRLLILVRHASRTRLAAKSEKEHRMEGWPEGQRPSPKV